MHIRNRTGDAARAGAAAAFLACVTAAYTWPLSLHLTDAIPHDTGDPLLVTWILWWSTHVMPLTERWWNAPAFYPSHGVFAFSETFLGIAPITAPFFWLGQPLLGYNVAFLLSFFLSGVSAYGLGFVLTRQHGAALVAAVAFAFPPFRLTHLAHLQMLSAFWMPISMVGLHMYSEDGRLRWAILFAGAWLLQVLTSGYYFFLFSVLVALWLARFALRWTPRRLATVAICWVVAAALAMPVLAGYKRIQASYGFHRTPFETAYYSADIAGLASAAPESLIWNRVHAVDQLESQLFPGATILLILVAGIAGARARGADAESRSTRQHFAFYTVAAVAMWTLALGPRPAYKGRPIGVSGPYEILMLLPGFDGIRVPARFWMISILCLSVAAALAVARTKSAGMRRLLVAAAVAGLLLDGWPAAMMLFPDPGMQVTHSAAVARLELPLRATETEAMYGAIADARPVFNGYSGYVAPQHYALGDLLARGETEIFQHLASGGPIEVVVRHEFDLEHRWRDLVASVDTAKMTIVTPGWTVYEIAAAPAMVTPPLGPRLAIARVEASTNTRDIGAVLDGDLVSRWHAPNQLGQESIVVDLGSMERPAAVVLALGRYSSEYPRVLEVSISTNRSDWQTVWTGDTALAAYDAAVRSPRDVPLTIPLPGRDARYLRLAQIGSDPDRAWSVVELEVSR